MTLWSTIENEMTFYRDKTQSELISLYKVIVRCTFDLPPGNGLASSPFPVKTEPGCVTEQGLVYWTGLRGSYPEVRSMGSRASV